MKRENKIGESGREERGEGKGGGNKEVTAWGKRRVE